MESSLLGGAVGGARLSCGGALQAPAPQPQMMQQQMPPQGGMNPQQQQMVRGGHHVILRYHVLSL